MSAILSALVSIFAIFGVTIMLFLALRSFITSCRVTPRRPDAWLGHVSLNFYNHPPQVWAAP